MEDYNIQRSIRRRVQALGAENQGLARQVKIMPLGSIDDLKIELHFKSVKFEDFTSSLTEICLAFGNKG